MCMNCIDRMTLRERIVLLGSIPLLLVMIIVGSIFVAPPDIDDFEPYYEIPVCPDCAYGSCAGCCRSFVSWPGVAGEACPAMGVSLQKDHCFGPTVCQSGNEDVYSSADPAVDSESCNHENVVEQCGSVANSCCCDVDGDCTDGDEEICCAFPAASNTYYATSPSMLNSNTYVYGGQTYTINEPNFTFGGMPQTLMFDTCTQGADGEDNLCKYDDEFKYFPVIYRRKEHAIALHYSVYDGDSKLVQSASVQLTADGRRLFSNGSSVLTKSVLPMPPTELPAEQQPIFSSALSSSPAAPSPGPTDRLLLKGGAGSTNPGRRTGYGRRTTAVIAGGTGMMIMSRRRRGGSQDCQRTGRGCEYTVQNTLDRDELFPDKAFELKLPMRIEIHSLRIQESSSASLQDVPELYITFGPVTDTEERQVRYAVGVPLVVIGCVGFFALFVYVLVKRDRLCGPEKVAPDESPPLQQGIEVPTVTATAVPTPAPVVVGGYDPVPAPAPPIQVTCGVCGNLMGVQPPVSLVACPSCGATNDVSAVREGWPRDKWVGQGLLTLYLRCLL